MANRFKLLDLRMKHPALSCYLRLRHYSDVASPRPERDHAACSKRDGYEMAVGTEAAINDLREEVLSRYPRA